MIRNEKPGGKDPKAPKDDRTKPMKSSTDPKGKPAKDAKPSMKPADPKRKPGKGEGTGSTKR